MSKVTTGTYKGNPTITLDADSKWPFTFGVAKARLVVEHFAAIKAFVDRNTPKGSDRFDRDVEDQMRERTGA